MDVPAEFKERLERVDPLLKAEWDNRRSRWKILRTNPVRPQLPPDLILLVREQDGSFRPLDNRTIDKLYSMDLARRYSGTKGTFGWRLEAEMRDLEDNLKRAKEKEAENRHKEVEERLAWNYNHYDGVVKKWHDLFRHKRKTSSQHVRIPKNA